MAKTKKKINPRHVPDDKIIVNSEAYGPHTRKKRRAGPVNSAMKESGNQLAKSSLVASVIKQALDPYRQDFYYGQWWQRLLTLYREMFKQGAYDHSKLVGLNLHDDYRLEKLISLQTAYTYHAGKVTFTLTTKNQPPNFKKLAYVDGYCLSLLALYFDATQKIVSIDFYKFPVYSLRKPAPTSFQYAFTVPVDAIKFVLCVKLEGCERGKPCQANSKAMKFVLAGDFDVPAPSKTIRLNKSGKHPGARSGTR